MSAVTPRWAVRLIASHIPAIHFYAYFDFFFDFFCDVLVIQQRVVQPPYVALGCMHFSGLSRSCSGAWVVLKGTDSIGHAFCALPRSKQLR